MFVTNRLKLFGIKIGYFDFAARAFEKGTGFLFQCAVEGFWLRVGMNNQDLRHGLKIKLNSRIAHVQTHLAAQDQCAVVVNVSCREIKNYWDTPVRAMI